MSITVTCLTAEEAIVYNQLAAKNQFHIASTFSADEEATLARLVDKICKANPADAVYPRNMDPYTIRTLGIRHGYRFLTRYAQIYGEETIPDEWYMYPMRNYAICSTDWPTADKQHLIQKEWLMDKIIRPVIPEYRLTDDFFAKGAEIFGLVFLPFCPENRISEKAAQAAASDGMIEYIPQRLMTQEICIDAFYEAAVTSGRDVIRYIPEKLKNDSSFWESVVSKCPVLLHYIPEEYRTKKVCHTAWNALPEEAFEVVCYDPCEEICSVQFEDYWEKTVGMDEFDDFGYSTPGFLQVVLGAIPEQFITAKMAEIAMQCDPRCYFLLPKNLRKEEYGKMVAAYSYGVKFTDFPDELHSLWLLCLKLMEAHDEGSIDCETDAIDYILEHLDYVSENEQEAFFAKLGGTEKAEALLDQDSYTWDEIDEIEKALKEASNFSENNCDLSRFGIFKYI